MSLAHGVLRSHRAARTGLPLRRAIESAALAEADGASLHAPSDRARDRAGPARPARRTDRATGDWAPSDSAWSGSGCTSIIRPSAPAATAARAIGITFERTPVPWLGSAMIGRCDSVHDRNRRQVEQVARLLVEAAHAALAQDDVLIAFGEDVLGAEQQLLRWSRPCRASAGPACRPAGARAAADSSACCAHRSG